MSLDGTLDEIRSRTDIVELISEHVALKRAGRNFKGLCPFHAEKTPSFIVSPERQSFHCFGCAAGGDIFGFVMKAEGLTFPEAKALLARRAGVVLKNEGTRERGLSEALRAVQAEAVKFYRAALGRSQAAQGYLKKRGVTEASAEAFSLGYAPDGWHALLDHMRALKHKDELLLKSGLFAQGQHGLYDVFRSRLVFPIMDAQGVAIAFSGRIVGEGEPKYLNSPDTPLFKKGDTLYALNRAKDEIRKKGRAVVVEGQMDVVMCHQAGVTNVVAPLGTALTESHIRRLGRYAERVLLLFDGDPAGVSAAKRSLEILLAGGMRSEVLLLPDGHDPDSFIREKGVDGFTAVLGEALSPVGFVLKASGAGKPGAGKSEAAREALAIVARAEEPLVRDELLAELADKTGVRELTLREELRRMKRPGGASAPERAKPVFYTEETLLLSAALMRPERAGEILERVDLSAFRDPVVKGILEKLAAAGGGPPAGLSEAEQSFVARLSIEPGFEPGDLDLNVEGCIGKLLKRRTEAEIKRLDADIKAAERVRDGELIRGLQTEKMKLIRGLA